MNYRSASSQTAAKRAFLPFCRLWAEVFIMLALACVVAAQAWQRYQGNNPPNLANCCGISQHMAVGHSQVHPIIQALK